MKILVALSGGVDSSGAAYLLKDMGHDVSGATMVLIDGKEKDALDAKKVAETLLIPFYEFNLKNEFCDKVIKEFVNSYERGETPNPCIVCNKCFKFGAFLDKAKEMGFDKIATGHYAKIEEKDGVFYLKKSKNAEKDQSYVLYNMTQKELSSVIFPLEDYEKEEIRKMAKKAGIEVSEKKDSQDICFVPMGDYKKIIDEVSERSHPEGDFLDKSGNVLGKHKGIINYTVGQRKGLGVTFGKPMYVYDIDAITNSVTLSENEELFTREFFVDNVSFTYFSEIPEEFRADVKIRYKHKEAPATIKKAEGGVIVIMDEAQRAVTKGQSAVFYDGDTVLGGGIIRKVIK